MKGKGQNSKEKVLEGLKAGMGSTLIIGLSAANSSMLGIVNLVYMILHPMGVVGTLLGNIGGSIFFNSISLILNTSFLVSRLKERNLYKKRNVEQEFDAKAKDKHTVRSIYLNMLCDALFLTGAIASIVLFGNPIAIFVTAPIVTLGCIVMAGDIVNSTHHKVKNFKNYLSQLSKEDQVSLQKEMKMEISESLFYKVVAKILPNIIVLAQLHAGTENKNREQEIKRLKAELKGIKFRQDDARQNNSNNLTNYKEENEMETTLEVKEVKEPHHGSTHLSLDENAIEKVKGSKEPARKGRLPF
ncbi:MAG: hypothetical protein PG981_000233 [Wolbachia endosymbiont of Ctenocephalides orientis wCori]|nr:MAG: hypothetical protein PG981_000233 [Wolbachia endosymbiont of Ctenocephalides orientis wCori]